jgi:hypothetical protein
MRSACGAPTFERKDDMKNLTIMGFAVGTVLAGCASTSGARSEPTTSAAAAPAHQHAHGDGDQAGMMAGMCPMQVPGTTVGATEIDGGSVLSFTTTTGDVAELRQRVRRMAEMHNQPSGHRMMGSHGAPGHEGGGRGGMMMGGGMMMPATTASVEDIEGGARGSPCSRRIPRSSERYASTSA